MLWILILIFGAIYQAIRRFFCRMLHTKKDWESVFDHKTFTVYRCKKCKAWHEIWPDGPVA